MHVQASFRAAEEEQRQVIAKHGHELSMDALNDMKVGGGHVIIPCCHP